MSEMSENVLPDFGGFEPEFEETEFTRLDLTPYRAVIAQLKPGKNATIVVPTGDLTASGRGLIELGHERGFRKAAHEAGYGMKAGHNHMPNGTTRLRFTVGEKRVWTPEQSKKRDASLARGRLDRWVLNQMATHPDWTREDAVKAYRTEQKRKQEASAS
jgi:hypothetical protein